MWNPHKYFSKKADIQTDGQTGVKWGIRNTAIKNFKNNRQQNLNWAIDARHDSPAETSVRLKNSFFRN